MSFPRKTSILDGIVKANLRSYVSMSKGDATRGLVGAFKDIAKRGGGAIVVDPGNYVVDPNLLGTIDIPDNVYLLGIGRPTFQIKKLFGDFFSIFSHSAKRNSLYVSGINFDSNTTSHGTGYPQTFNLPKCHFWFALNSDNVVFEDCGFKYHGVNCITTTTGNEGLGLYNNSFEYFLHDGIPNNAQGRKYVDNSAIYSISRNTYAEDLRFKSSSLANLGMGGIEFHAPGGWLLRSKSEKMSTLCNVAPDSGFIEPTNITVRDCNAIDANNAFMLWPASLLSNVEFINNRMNILQKQWALYSYCGFGMGSGTGLLQDVVIDGSRIEFEQETVVRAPAVVDPRGSGAGLQQPFCGGIVMTSDEVGVTTNLMLTRNRVYYSPHPGIRVGSDNFLKTYNEIEIASNILRDCGSYPASSNDFESYIYMRGFFNRPRVVGNKLFETWGTQQGRYWINANSASFTNGLHAHNDKIQPGGYTVADNLHANWAAGA